MARRRVIYKLKRVGQETRPPAFGSFLLLVQSGQATLCEPLGGLLICSEEEVCIWGGDNLVERPLRGGSEGVFSGLRAGLPSVEPQTRSPPLVYL